MTAQPATQISVWHLDPAHSLAEFSVKHMMFTTVKGQFNELRGTIHLDEAEPARSTVEAEIPAATVDTRAPDRDAHLRSPDFFDVEHHPTITFRSTRVELTGEGRGRVHGELTIRGVTRPVVLETVFNGRGKNPFGKEVIGFTARTTINRKEFGLTWNTPLEAGGWLVGDEVQILLEVQAVRQE
ncbi:MAG TPA: YceI family protein [Dehalococcoidia bacterium]